jgi:hypothetical protein
MTIYNLILFLHILAAFGVVVSFGLEWLSLDGLQRSCSTEQTRGAMREFGLLPRISAPSYVVVLLSGIYLWESSWIGAGWTVIALFSLAAIAVIGAATTGPRMANLGKTMAEKSVEAFDAARVLHLPFLWMSLQLRSWMTIGIIILMTMKPGAGASLVVVIAAVLVGLTVNLAALTYYRRHDLCAVERARNAGTGRFSSPR